MPLTRRDFVKVTSAAGAALGLNQTIANARQQQSSAPAARVGKPLRILILGGTGFIGPYQVRYALDRGHKVTLFNRGKTNPGLFPEVEKLEGDRVTGNLTALKGREWDAVIDNPSTLPRWVRDAAGMLKDSAKQYVFISTISVYDDNSKPGMDESTSLAKMDESSPLTTTPDPRTKGVMESYGALKALAEREAEKAFPARATIIRPGLIVGAGDPSDRFTYWPVRIDRGGEVLAPGEQTDPVQFIDARDLGEWTIRMVEQNATGVYNATGPRAPLSIAEMLYGIRAITTSDVRFTWVNTDFLQKEKVRPWADMPVWVPGQGETAGFAAVSIRRALDKGLAFRPLADTARAALEAYKALPADRREKMRAGIAAEREQAVLAAWHANRKKS